MKKRRIFTAALRASLVALLAVALSACFSPWAGGEGTITLVFAPTAVPVTPVATAFAPFDEPEPDMRHVVTLQGPGGTITHEFTGPGPERIAVLFGTWTVSVRAYFAFPPDFDSLIGSFPPYTPPLRAISREAAVVEVIAGETAIANITMTHAAEVGTYAQLNGVLGFASARGMEKVIILAQSFIVGNADSEYPLRIQDNITLVSDTDVTITVGDGVDMDSIFSVEGGGALTLGRPGMAGTITLNGAELNDGIITVADGGTLVMEDGSRLTGNAVTTDYTGGGVRIASGGATFNMTGGRIEDNNATGNGGGVHVTNGGTFNMFGGSIAGNSATTDGGGVFVSDGATFTMHGGTISGSNSTNQNTAEDEGCAIYVGEHATAQYDGALLEQFGPDIQTSDYALPKDFRNGVD